MNLNEFCRALPKVELHAHLNTSYSVDSLRELMALDGGGTELSDLTLEGNQDIDESFKLFPKIQKLVQTEEAVYKLTYKVIEENALDNVKYLELRSTPKENSSTGMTRRRYLETMLRAVQDCQTAGMDIVVRLLPSIDRRLGLAVARRTVDLAAQLMRETQGVVVGVDFSGDPKVGDAADYIPVLLEAHQRGLSLALHLAELPLFEETIKVLQACSKCNVRIGHGTYLHRFEKEEMNSEMEKLVISSKFPVECCITSNQKTLTASPDEHQFQHWRARGHPSVICTDGKGVCNSNLSQELLLAASALHLSKADLKAHALASVSHVFDVTAQDALRDKFTKILSELE